MIVSTILRPKPFLLCCRRVSARAPRLVMRLGLVAAAQRMTRRAVGMVGARMVGLVILLPRLARQATGGRRCIGRVMQPAMPIRRHARSFSHTVINDPAFTPATGDHALVLE